MSFATDKWFQHIRRDLLTEGLADIGISQQIQDNITSALPDASEKGRVWVGNSWKTLPARRVRNYGWFEDIVGKILTKYAPAGEGESEFNPVKTLIDAYTSKSVGDWEKLTRRFPKAAAKSNLPDDVVQGVLEDLRELEARTWRWFSGTRIPNVMKLLKQNANNYKIIQSIPPADQKYAEEQSDEFLSNTEDPNRIIHRFEDGFYWYDIGLKYCEIEGKRMSHCAADDDGTLYSLRKKEKNRISSDSYVTISYDSKDKTIYQIKAKANQAPPEKFWNHIAKFIEIVGAEDVKETGEYTSQEREFALLNNFLSEKTGINSKNSYKVKEEEMERELREIYAGFETSVYSKYCKIAGYSVRAVEFTDGKQPIWTDSLYAAAADLEFEVTEKIINALQGDNGLQLEEKLAFAIMSEERNNIFENPDANQLVPILLKSDTPEGAIQKARNINLRTSPEALLRGKRNFLVIDGIAGAFADFSEEGHYDNRRGEDYSYWLQLVKNLLDDLEDGAAAVEGVLENEGLLGDQAEPVQEARANPLDVRLYEIDFVMSYPLGKGFEMTDIHNIVRAIPDVTTVRTVGETKRTQANRTVSLQRLKFALQGQTPRNEWVKQVLLPQIHKISTDIRIHKVERADLVSNSKQRLEETYAAFSQRPSAPRTTPRPTIQGLIDDWVEGGVMYDQPTNINLTRYSVMMPVADLEHLCGREPRKHGHHFDAGYENFIKNGPRDPIYLAIGKNGRAKITGNEDDLRYAIKAGVEEVPVFISYQRQV